MSRLAMGTGTHGGNKHSNQTKLGFQGVADLFHAAYDQGVTFWDSADQYGSHPYLKEALKSVPRDELGTGYIDIQLMHKMEDADWNVRMRGVMDVISRHRRRDRAHARHINPTQAHMDADPQTVISVLLSLDCVDCMTIGSESRAAMEDLLRKMPAAGTRG